MAAESTDPIERWTAKRRAALIMSILKGETSIPEAARTHGLTVAEVEDWREKFLLGAVPYAVDRRESQSGLPRAEAEAMVRASTSLHPSPTRAGLGESHQSEQRTMGDGCDPYSVWRRWL